MNDWDKMMGFTAEDPQPGTPDLDELASPVFALWTQAKASLDYDEKAWLAYMTLLAEHAARVATLRAELRRFHVAAKMLREIINEHDENVPRGTE